MPVICKSKSSTANYLPLTSVFFCQTTEKVCNLIASHNGNSSQQLCRDPLCRCLKVITKEVRSNKWSSFSSAATMHPLLDLNGLHVCIHACNTCTKWVNWLEAIFFNVAAEEQMLLFWKVVESCRYIWGIMSVNILTSANVPYETQTWGDFYTKLGPLVLLDLCEWGSTVHNVTYIC